MSEKSNKKSGIPAPLISGPPQAPQLSQRNSNPLPNVNDNTDSQPNKLPKMNSERMPGHRLPAPPHSQTTQSQSSMQTQPHPQILMSTSEKNVNKLNSSILNSNNMNNPNISIPINGNSINDKLNSNNVILHHKKPNNDKIHKKEDLEDEEDDDLDDDDDDDFDKKIASSDEEVEMTGNVATIVRKEKTMLPTKEENNNEEKSKHPSPKIVDIDHKVDKLHDLKESKKDESTREDKLHAEKMDVEETLEKGEVPATSQAEKSFNQVNSKKRKSMHDDENYDEDD